MKNEDLEIKNEVVKEEPDDPKKFKFFTAKNIIIAVGVLAIIIGIIVMAVIVAMQPNNAT